MEYNYKFQFIRGDFMRNFIAGIFIGAGAILPGISSGVLLCSFRAL